MLIIIHAGSQCGRTEVSPTERFSMNTFTTLVSTHTYNFALVQIRKDWIGEAASPQSHWYYAVFRILTMSYECSQTKRQYCPTHHWPALKVKSGWTASRRRFTVSDSSMMPHTCAGYTPLTQTDTQTLQM